MIRECWGNFLPSSTSSFVSFRPERWDWRKKPSHGRCLLYGRDLLRPLSLCIEHQRGYTTQRDSAIIFSCVIISSPTLIFGLNTSSASETWTLTSSVSTSPRQTSKKRGRKEPTKHTEYIVLLTSNLLYPCNQQVLTTWNTQQQY